MGRAVSFELNLNTETVDHCYPVEPLCLAPTETVAEAMRQMRDHNRGAVMVCRDQRVLGIFTERDALRVMAAGRGFDAPLEHAMTADPVVLRPTDKVARAISLMSKGGYRRLPIIDAAGKPTGILRVKGILHYLVEHFPAVVYNLPPEPHQTTHEREGA
jgi:predicted transcriptional regulator